MTMIDTPGQEYFYRLRTNGSMAADIGILVVDCATGVCDQTQEAIGCIEESEIPAVVALNKIDLVSETKIDEVEKELQQFVALEQSPFLRMSAVSSVRSLRTYLDQFSEDWMKQGRTISTITNKLAGGVLLDTWQSRSKGRQMLVLVKYGNFIPGGYFLAGELGGKVRVSHVTCRSLILQL